MSKRMHRSMDKLSIWKQNQKFSQTICDTYMPLSRQLSITLTRLADCDVRYRRSSSRVTPGLNDLQTPLLCSPSLPVRM